MGRIKLACLLLWCHSASYLSCVNTLLLEHRDLFDTFSDFTCETRNAPLLVICRERKKNIYSVEAVWKRSNQTVGNWRDIHTVVAVGKDQIETVGN